MARLFAGKTRHLDWRWDGAEGGRLGLPAPSALGREGVEGMELQGAGSRKQAGKLRWLLAAGCSKLAAQAGTADTIARSELLPGMAMMWAEDLDGITCECVADCRLQLQRPRQKG